jgi:ATP-binding cassette subfamily F protein uup
VRFLSGGERNRVLLARLFTKPANVIVLDEPTNDLDSESLELLEERLIDFKGTVLLVSHDREFLNNVVTSTIVFEDGHVREYVGGYNDWQHQRAAMQDAAPAVGKARNQSKGKTANASSSRNAAAPTAPAGTAQPPTSDHNAKPRRLSYKENRELESLPGNIEQLEQEITARHAAMADPGFYRQSGELIAKQQAELADLDARLAAAYARWGELEK